MAKIAYIEQTSNEYMRQGFNLLEVPIELKNRFELDMQSALMNVAGISISTSTRFIQYENLVKCYHENHINPFKVNTITMGMQDKLQLKDFFDPSVVPPEIYSRPIFIHLDLSINGDKTGIGAVAVMGYKNETRYSIEHGEVETTKELYYHHVFSCRIQAPSTDEISMQKTLEFLYYLKFILGWNIWGVSTDGFQSNMFRQSLKTAGFENVDLVSLDRTPDGYITYKYAINEQRISHLNIPELEYEIINLAKDNVTGKINHDVDKSKDESDGLAGAVYNASLHEQDLNLGAGDMFDVIMNVNDNEDTEIANDMSLLDKMVSTRIDTVEEAIKQINPFNTDKDDASGFFFL